MLNFLTDELRENRLFQSKLNLSERSNRYCPVITEKEALNEVGSNLQISGLGPDLAEFFVMVFFLDWKSFATFPGRISTAGKSSLLCLLIVPDGFFAWLQSWHFSS